MRGIDFLGDIHGQAGLLRGVLRQLGYKQKGRVFRHPGRMAVFLGDILNRGPAIRSTVNIVRPMVDAGNAICLLGNHEAFAIWDRLRLQSPTKFSYVPEKADRHLADSKAAYRGRVAEWDALVNWLWRRPLFLDHRMVRAIHACWHPRSLLLLRRNRLVEGNFDPGKPEFHALWRILEGPTARHPQTAKKFRIRWWERQATTWAGFAFGSQTDLPRLALPQARLSLASPYPNDSPPCFFGHYGFPKPCAPLLSNLACLDLAVAQGGPIGVYRWSGEPRLRQDHFFTSGNPA